jgi:hypothetical protein
MMVNGHIRNRHCEKVVVVLLPDNVQLKAYQRGPRRHDTSGGVAAESREILGYNYSIFVARSIVWFAELWTLLVFLFYRWTPFT